MEIQMTSDLSDYQKQQEANENAFFEVLGKLFPDLYVLIKMIVDNNLSLTVFWKLARALVNINAGTGYGNINIVIEDKTITFLHAIEKDRISEPIRKQE